jgi:hypothetical protein
MELKQTVSGQRIRYQSLGISFVVGLAAQSVDTFFSAQHL